MSTAMTAEQLIDVMEKTISQSLEEMKNFPNRIDEMTPNEYAIASIGCKLCGTLQFLEKFIGDWKSGLRQ